MKAISAVAYLKLTTEDWRSEVGFVFRKAVVIAELVVEEMDLKFDPITYYTDSKVVLGYIHNQAGKFYVYVNNWVQRIRQSSSPDQWRYVPTDHSPADHGSPQPASAAQLGYLDQLSSRIPLYTSQNLKRPLTL